MTAITKQVRTGFQLLAEGRLREVARRAGARFGGRMFERTVAFGLRRDLTVPFPAPAARIAITVREATETDAAHLFEHLPEDTDPADRQELAWRHAHFRNRIPTCYVAIDEATGRPCYVQWLMTASSNAEIQRLGPFPVLEADEALLENAFTPKAYRGLGIMPAAMAQIAEKGTALGARYVYTFVGDDNIPSLKGCEKAGFSPHLTRTVTTRFFNLSKRVAFGVSTDGYPLSHRAG
ncbi:GNAT family N-acetyltransferase [Methylobacterium sp. Leaf466]|uniref:GNAT family N-acetyltransferase n=1 Tax=Methylobacterium sp. Leaf466 TaxID=1736386 RepID=UPI0006F5BCFD|nr:GNAT family N-acetyltransferase [Methylobacterium sp. Leaf466]KQT78211.1 hypothetical protein ASG59_09525 [Methylobacterium sp. Leaf466]